MRPLLRVWLLPSTPMKEDRLATSGSFRNRSASWRWRVAMASKLTVGPASVIAWMKPVSCTGKNPLGMAM